PLQLHQEPHSRLRVGFFRLAIRVDRDGHEFALGTDAGPPADQREARRRGPPVSRSDRAPATTVNPRSSTSRTGRARRKARFRGRSSQEHCPAVGASPTMGPRAATAVEWTGDRTLAWRAIDHYSGPRAFVHLALARMA